MPPPTVPLAHAPTAPVTVPDAVRALAPGTDPVAVWVNARGGLTFRLDAHRFVKWVPADAAELDLAAEAARLTWARGWTSVPEVLDLGRDDEGSWLVTAALPGRSAVDPAWRDDRPVEAATAVGRGLRALHDALPVDLCPWAWSVHERTRRAAEHLDAGDSPTSWSAEHQHLSADEARARLAAPPAPDVLVVCQGDPCAPNTLLADDGTVTGHVDLGTLGVADRWADLAIAAWSADWNYGPGHDEHVYAGYGIDPDPVRIAYYRLLWDAS